MQDFFSGSDAEQPQTLDGNQQLQQSEARRHPIAVFFHVGFKVAALVAYLLLKWFYDHFILSFIIVVVILAADFWTVKNVTGRLMVGLRWWHYVKEDGSNVWMFESSRGPTHTVESVIFCTCAHNSSYAKNET